MKSWIKTSGIFILILTVILSLAVFSAGNKQTAPDSGIKTRTDSQSGKAQKTIVVGFSMDTLEEERWRKDRDYFIASVQKLGADVNVQAANSDDAKQLAQAEYLISQHVDVLVVVPHNADASAAIVAKAHAAGIKVLSYDRLIKNSSVDLYVSFDNERVGQMQAAAITKLAPKGSYALIEGADSDYNAHLFKQGQMDILQPLIDKGDIHVVYDQWTKEWEPTIALANMKNALKSNLNHIDAVLAANDSTAGAVVEALKAQGLAGKIPVSGQDADLAGCQRIIEGTQTMTVYKPIKALAEKAAELAVDLANGKSVATVRTINNGKIDVPSILLDPIAVDKTNMDATVISDGFHKKEEVYKNAGRQ
ncbi:D-xylose ABC transporter substrate-binding protein [Ferviditalea candida]|uniref:D-xylose ABC transporter substrate-binding protein n=1 Tax=Ferviditalea candida TaxID=3108399 RepID=A0ABU5ZFX0_9BACL|nr:D-xylose ABC transporter substrate-binding protein [Paenibacillaceae bacterium T2]